MLFYEQNGSGKNIIIIIISIKVFILLSATKHITLV